MALIVDAAEFDTGTALSRSSGLSDNSKITIVCFFNSSGMTSLDKYFFIGGQFCYLYLDGSGRLNFLAEDGLGSSFSFVTSASYDDANSHSVALSVDTNFSAGNKVYRLYIDRAAVTPTVTDAHAAFTINLGSPFTDNVGDGTDSVACLAELSVKTGVQFDFSDTATLNKFVTTGNKPEDIGTDGSTAYGSAADIYLHLDDGEAPANFALNRGTGGDFTITGTLATCATSPSDGGAPTQIVSPMPFFNTTFINE